MAKVVEKASIAALAADSGEIGRTACGGMVDEDELSRIRCALSGFFAMLTDSAGGVVMKPHVI